MKKILCALFSILSLLSYAQKQWKVTDYKISFNVKNAGFKVDGKFNQFNAYVLFDTSTLSLCKINATILSSSINTGNESRDAHLKKEDFFDVKQFPEINITSNFFGKTNTLFRGYFTLKIKDISKNIIIPFTFEEAKDKAVLKSNFVLNRRDYNIGDKSFILSDNVNVSLNVSIEKQ